MQPRLVSTAVGYNTQQGTFSVLLHRLILNNGDSLLTSWSIAACGQLIATLQNYINSSSEPEDIIAEQEFKSKEEQLTKDEIEAPGINAFVSGVIGTVIDRDLHLQIVFSKSGEAKNIVIGHDDARSLFDYTGNALKAAGVLEKAIQHAFLLTQPLTLFTCKMSADGKKIHHTLNENFDPYHYRMLQNLYSIVIIDISDPAKKHVIGSLFFKTAEKYDHPTFSSKIIESIKNSPELNSLLTKRVSFKPITILDPDEGPLTEDEMLREFIEQYTKYSTSGNA
ncbi:hypothetical protein [Pseudomonas farris]